jgi:hypothetical protein
MTESDDNTNLTLLKIYFFKPFSTCNTIPMVYLKIFYVSVLIPLQVNNSYNSHGISQYTHLRCLCQNTITGQ